MYCILLLPNCILGAFCIVFFYFVFGMRISTDTLIAAVCDTSDKVITKHFSQTILLYTIESSNLQRSHQVKCHQVQEKCHQVPGSEDLGPRKVLKQFHKKRGVSFSWSLVNVSLFSTSSTPAKVSL